MNQAILLRLGQFSTNDIALFEKYSTKKNLHKNQILLKQGEVCRSVYYILSGAFFQFQTTAITENIIDLHLPDEWMFNHQSLVAQSPSTTTISAFTKAEIIELSLTGLHQLIAQSQAFLQFGHLLNQSSNRVYLFDNLLNPAQKYDYITKAKPLIAQLFPVKMIASYLKMAPETLSRVRASN